MAKSSTLGQVVQSVQPDEVRQFLHQLVAIPSSYDSPHREADVADYIADQLLAIGVEVEVRAVTDGRPNVIASIRGEGGGPTLALNGHMDTVPGSDMDIPPFKPRQEGDTVYGRGTADMKGALAAMMGCMATLHRSGVALRGDLHFTAVIDEELNGQGTRDIVKHGPLADFAIVGEPTNLCVALGHKGLEWIEVKVQGREAHSGRAEQGINAIAKASDFIQFVTQQLQPILKRRRHELLGTSTLNFGRIEGGQQPSTVAGTCTLQLDRRWLPEETVASVYDELKKAIDDLAKRDSQFHAEIHPHPASQDVPHQPVLISEDHPSVELVRQAVSWVTGADSRYIAFPAWTDASLLYHLGGIETVILGPGDLKQAHSAVEYVSLPQVVDAARIYALAAMSICGVAGHT